MRSNILRRAIASEPEETNKLVKDIIRNRKEGELLNKYKIESEGISKRIRDRIYILFKDQDEINSIKKRFVGEGKQSRG